MSPNDRGCVETQNYGDVRKIGLPGCAVSHSLTSVDGRKTPKIVLAMSFHTASTRSGRLERAVSVERTINQRYASHSIWGLDATHICAERLLRSKFENFAIRDVKEMATPDIPSFSGIFPS